MRYTIPIETITPIWTGDNNRKTSYLRATSFLGGLRFWTEALLCSLGETVCDITGENPCVYDPDKGKTACAACQIFGCTGLGRSFGLKVVDVKTNPGDDQRIIFKPYPLTHNDGTPKMKNGQQEMSRPPTWFLPPGLKGDFSLVFSPFRPSYGNDQIAIEPRLVLASHLLLHWGTLGAKDHYGYGLVKASPPAEFTTLVRKAAKGVAIVNATLPADGLPSLQDFFFFTGKVNKDIELPHSQDNNKPRDIPFEIRYQVRSGLRDPTDKQKHVGLRHFFCGVTSQGQRKVEATKFNMGLDGDTLYGWGYFPRAGNMATHRDRCLNLLQTTLTSHCLQSIKWKEFNATRDNCNSPQNWGGFLQELAEQPWR